MKTTSKNNGKELTVKLSKKSQLLNLRRILRILIGGALLLTLSKTATSQIRIGLIGGPNFSTQFIELENRGEMHWRVNYSIGGIIDIPLSDHVSISAEPMFLRKGSRVEAILNVENYIFNNSYLEIPVLAKYSIGNKVRPYLVAGPSMGFLLKADFGGNYMDDDYSANFHEVTKKIDFSLVSGAGVSFRVGLATLFIESQYTLGLVNTSVDGTVHVTAGNQVLEIEVKDETIKNRGVQVMVGIALPLGK